MSNSTNTESVYEEIFEFRLVAAIDFGTTYSGYAYSFHDDPLTFFCPQTWYAGQGNLSSLKTPTCLLLNPDQSFNSFGYAAENKYVHLASEGKHLDYYFFMRFKMDLHWKDMTHDTEINDVTGKGLPAILVFSSSIKYLKDHLFQTLEDRGHTVETSQILFVLTVPAIWTESAKQFMRTAAVQAGVHTNQLVYKTATRKYAFKITSFLNIQFKKCGTADFSVHEVNEDGTLTEIHMATGGPYAGTIVDEEYLKLYSKIFGYKTMQKLKANDMEEYLAIARNFETKKRLVCEEYMESFNVKLATTLSKRFKSKPKKFKKNIAEIGMKDFISIDGDKIKFAPSAIKSLFCTPVGGIVSHIQNLLKEHEEVKSILLVGGFSESRLLQEEIKKAIVDKTFVIPNECGLAVLKGAVLYGHRPLSITARIMKYTYGVASDSIFKEGIHPNTRKYKDENGEFRCKRSFSILIAKGTKVSTTGVEIIRTSEPITTTQMSVAERVYYTDKENPVVVDENCKLLKGYKLSLPENNGKPRIVKSIFTFGLTEMKYRSEVIETGIQTEGTLDLL
ncbi:heat shock 70 kDa protein 12A-like [Saccostrea cucullata]|uniref:heat shock 70 kDa protein 12A-like n=1 Tax=Saccostrea cuccullata TaxID=36930 RepID=UPI002ED48C14